LGCVPLIGQYDCVVTVRQILSMCVEIIIASLISTAA